MKTKYCYNLHPADMGDPSVAIVRVILIIYGEIGYHETSWTFPKNIALDGVNCMNAKKGVTPQMAGQWLSCCIFDTWQTLESSSLPVFTIPTVQGLADMLKKLNEEADAKLLVHQEGEVTQFNEVCREIAKAKNRIEATFRPCPEIPGICSQLAAGRVFVSRTVKDSQSRLGAFFDPRQDTLATALRGLGVDI